MAMNDFALDTQGDIAVVGGDLVLTDSISQAVRIALRWVKGEWKYNPELGVDYFQSILKKDPDLNEVSRMIREAVLSVDGVESVSSCEIEIDKVKRKMTARIVAFCDGERLESEVIYDV